MRVYGLKPEEQIEIRNLLQKHFGDLEGVKVFLFGSRAKGNQKAFSDIDLAIKSKAKDLPQRIALFQEDWERSKIPYKADITSWAELFKPYLPEIRKTKKEFWRPEKKLLHPWRACPYGEHWVVRHPRLPVGRQLQDVDGHCRKNQLGKDRLDLQEIELISLLPDFQASIPRPSVYNGPENIPFANNYDYLIAGWCKYWNEVLLPDVPLSPNLIKALIESESRFKPLSTAPNRNVGLANGLIQLTEQTFKILRDRKGELKDHYIDLAKSEWFHPSANICAGIRWLFWKRHILSKRIKESPSWADTVAEYKGIYKDLKKGEKKSMKVYAEFIKILSRYAIVLCFLLASSASFAAPADESGNYKFERQVPSKKIIPECEISSGAERGAFGIDYQEGVIAHVFLVLTGVYRERCHYFVNEIEKLKRKYPALIIYASEKKFDGEKNLSWRWRSLRSPDGEYCLSYFLHDCDEEPSFKHNKLHSK